MPTFEFDFQRYVARRKGAREAQVREGAAYAYPGDVRLLRTLDKLRPIQLALEEAGRLWRGVARAELLGASVRAAGERFSQVQQAAVRCAQVLHIEVPTIYVAPQPSAAGVLSLGTAEDVYIVLSAGLLDLLSPEELLDVLGRECGRIQNGHVPFLTALHYLKVSRRRFLRWVVKPATLTLTAWSRRADVTADRAGLLCTRSLDISLAAMSKTAPRSNEEDSPAPASAVPRAGVMAQNLSRRQRALTRFAGSLYFHTVLGREKEGGESPEECDAAVTRILDDRAEVSASTGEA